MKLVFDFSRQCISVEGDGPELLELAGIARELAPNLPKIEIQTVMKDHQGESSTESTVIRKPDAKVNGETVKQFVKKLSLNNNYERIAAIAFFKKHREDIATFTPKDMAGWFTNCGLKRPAQMPVAFGDCRKRSDYIESQSYGNWRITTNGENLVVGKVEELEGE